MEDKKVEKFVKDADKVNISTKIGDTLYNYGTILVLLFMCLILTFIAPNFLTAVNLLNVLRQISMIGITALGVTMVIIAGGIDLSSGSLISLVSVIIGVFAHTQNMPVTSILGLDKIINTPEVRTFPLIVIILIGLSIGALSGFINGALIAYGRIPAFVVTLGAFTSLRGLSYLLSEGVPTGYFRIPFLFIGRSSLFNIPFPVIILVFLSLISHYIMSKTSFGRHIYAIGGNSNTARAAGINVKKHIVVAFIFAGLMASIAAIILTSRLTSGHPGGGMYMEFDAITAAVVGGTSLSGGIGFMPGTIIGALIVGILKNGLQLMGVSAYWQRIVTGLIIIFAVFLDQKKHAKRTQGVGFT